MAMRFLGAKTGRLITWLTSTWLLIGCQTKKEHTTLYAEPAGQYEVWFPVEPHLAIPATLSPAIAALSTLREATPTDDDNLFYRVSYGTTQVPIFHSDSLVFIQDFLWNTQFALRDSARLIRRGAFQLHGYQGADFTWQSRVLGARGLLIRTRILLVENRLYSLTVVGKATRSPRANHFFTSFHLLRTRLGTAPVAHYKTPGYPGEIIETRYPTGAASSTCQVTAGTVERPVTTLRRKYDQLGQLLSEGQYRDGRQDGAMRTWYTNGTLASESTFRHDTLYGCTTEYYRNGKPEIILCQDSASTPKVAAFYGLDGKRQPDAHQYVRSLLHQSGPRWPLTQHTTARTQCVTANARSRKAPDAYCDCLLNCVEKRVYPTEYLLMGSYTANVLAELVDCKECAQF